MKAQRIYLKALLAASILILAAGCARKVETRTEDRKYQASFLTLFNTVSTIVGYSESEESFRTVSESIHDELLVYHQLYDIYSSYPGITSLKDVNDRAGTEPVKVDGRIIELLLFCKDVYDATEGRVNAAMGAVLSLWHDAREDSLSDPENAYLPDASELREASLHIDFDDVVIDEDASTVFFRDPELRLDVGAIAKGFAVQKVSEAFDGPFLLSVGGNVSAIGPKPNGGAWVIGVQDPYGENDSYIHTLSVKEGNIVTSGDYQRYYEVDGKSYHHIIDPDTLLPADKWKAVTVVASSSAVADALSTALFLMPLEEGKTLLAEYGAEAYWLDLNGNEFFSDGFDRLLRT